METKHQKRSKFLNSNGSQKKKTTDESESMRRTPERQATKMMNAFPETGVLRWAVLVETLLMLMRATLFNARPFVQFNCIRQSWRAGEERRSNEAISLCVF